MAGRMYLGNEMVTPAIVSGGVDSVNGQTGEVVLTASDVNALPDTTKYAKTLGLSMNQTTFVLSWQLYDQNGDAIGQVQTVDLPLESVVVNATYDSTNKKIVLTLENGTTVDVPVGDLVEGLQSEITITNMLSSDLVDDTNKTHKFVTTEEKTTWNNKQNAISDLATIRSGAAKGATAVQPSAIANMQTTANLVTSVSYSSTDTQYPSAKCVYDKAEEIWSDLDDEIDARINMDNMLNDRIGDVRAGIIDKISSNYAVNDFATNCLLEISEDLKLELSNGTLTLKNGSVCTKTDGTQASIDSDKTITVSTNGTYLIYCKTVNQLESIELSNVYSSDTAPTGSGKLLWLDITNIIFKESTDGGSSWTNDIFLPICVVTVSNGSISSIDKTFNGLGFIGNSIYALPNIVCLFSDGRDENGNVKSIKYKNENVLFFLKNMNVYYSGSIYIGENELFVTDGPAITDTPPTYGFYWYSPKINKMFYGRSGITITKKNLIVCGEAFYGSHLLNSFDIRTVSGMSCTNITTALGYTPYNGATNPNGYITSSAVNNPTITFTQGGVSKGSITLNQSSDETIALDAGGGTDDWGQSLQGDVVINNTYICAPQKCYANQRITSFSAPNAIEADLNNCFSICENFQSFSTPNLETIGPNGFSSCCGGCSSLTSVASFDKLKTLKRSAMSSFANGCILLEDVYFPALTTSSFVDATNQFYSFWNNTGTTKTHTMHFPSNLQTTISGLTGYPNFGGISGYVVLAFDLPATS